MVWQFSVAQDIGSRSEQQDRIAIFPIPAKQAYLLVLADGMGGHRSGALAAQQVVSVAQGSCTELPWVDPQAFLENLCVAAHEQILLLDDDATRSPGSTCLFMLVRREEVYWAHVGDSRLYHLRDGKILSRTRDHSLAEMMTISDPVGDAVMAPGPGRQLYMRLGGSEYPQAVSDGLIAEHGDAFLLCSDGLWDALPERDLLATSNAGHCIDDEVTRQMVDSARDCGGVRADNISVIIARWSARRLGLFRPFSRPIFSALSAGVADLQRACR
jgi:serine/threonine protein phosphatase PrpC